ncbi:DUF3311 domain-containing protein [Acidianus brierleyi]|uniref:DUF3311 domain-containing protein n=1 Tax=Acidianus brierleyi TaxID=41673 RepID=A0A2U9IB62_9CREN|nr:DUF3311 domain-containing protein [Acidianus brierleyi]AWR93245.1 DUF3311 domain-containing protein [Acidianus brierleyi]
MIKTKFYLALFITLIVDIILYSVFPFFNRIYPELFGLPLFYWYQTILLVVSSLMFLGITLIFKEVE